MNYETLIKEADTEGLTIREKPLLGNDGRIKGSQILIRENMSSKQKACVLAEEMGHYYTTVGDILNQSNSENRKQEHRARLWAYNKKIGLSRLIKAYKAKCNTLYDISEFLDVSEDFLQEALEYYREIYGTGTMVDKYFIQFEPNLQVYTYQPIIK